MPGTPDAQLLIVDLDQLQDDELCLALGTGKPPLLLQFWMVSKGRSESHSCPRNVCIIVGRSCSALGDQIPRVCCILAVHFKVRLLFQPPGYSMRDLTDPRWIKLKGILFLCLGIIASGLILVETRSLWWAFSS